jgi:gamma-glutamyltranspeptidase/glutathione hydrolase
MSRHQTAFTAPHYKAAEAGQAILDQGGTACEAMVAAAAMIAVQYPHMNSLGGDSFWLISELGKDPIAIDGCGGAALNLDLASYRNRGSSLPASGGDAAITMAGTVAAWNKALALNNSGITLTTLLSSAIEAARDGIEVTASLQAASEKTFARLANIQSFSDLYLKQNKTLVAGDRLTNPALAETLHRLAMAGLADFYSGEIASKLANDLKQQGSPLDLDDFSRYQATVVEPLKAEISLGELYNFGAPTQGVASLLILAIYDRMAHLAQSEIDHTHLLVEATKQAFMLRDRWVCDHAYLEQDLQRLLSAEHIDQCVEQITLAQAMPWPHIANPGDTVWMGALDQYGTMVSFIQSVYWEFGSGVVSPSTGIVWNNRAMSFSLDADHHNALVPGKKPFHTLNPAYAQLVDGRRVVYGTMGGEGQPQTQACLFSRYFYQGFTLADAIAEPRWLLGRTWGDDTHQLRLENTLHQRIGTELAQRQHDITSVADDNELMGHAGAIVLEPSGQAVAATDPRSDGKALLGDIQ